jgi:protein-disulfide isomerase
MIVEQQQQQHPASTNNDEAYIEVERKEKPMQSDVSVTIPRSTINYIVVGIVFFALGLVIGMIGYDRFVQANRAADQTLMEQTVEQTLRTLLGDEALNTAQQPRLNPNEVYAIDAAGNPFRGPEDAPITIIEFGDFRCSYCKRFEDTTLAPLLARYPDQVRLVYRDYPILGQSSQESAMAAECADDQGKFWEFHDLLFGDQANLTRAGFMAKAQTLDMDMVAFTACYDNGAHREEIFADLQAGQALGVGGTPTFFINGRPIIGAQPIDTFVRVIEEELTRLAESTPEAPAN